MLKRPLLDLGLGCQKSERVLVPCGNSTSTTCESELKMFMLSSYSFLGVTSFAPSKVSASLPFALLLLLLPYIDIFSPLVNSTDPRIELFRFLSPGPPSFDSETFDSDPIPFKASILAFLFSMALSSCADILYCSSLAILPCSSSFYFFI